MKPCSRAALAAAALLCLAVLAGASSARVVAEADSAVSNLSLQPAATKVEQTAAPPATKVESGQTAAAVPQIDEEDDGANAEADVAATKGLNDPAQLDLTTVAPAPAINVGPSSLNGTCDGTGTCCKGFKCMYVAGVCCDTGFCCPVGTTCVVAGPGQPQQCSPGMNGKVLTIPVPYLARDYGEEKMKHIAQIAAEHKQAEAIKAKKLADIQNEEKAKEAKMTASEEKTKAALQKEADKPVADSPSVSPPAVQSAFSVSASLKEAQANAQEFALQYVAGDALAAQDGEVEAQHRLQMLNQEIRVKEAHHYKRLDKHIQNIQGQRSTLVDNQLNGVEREIRSVRESLRLADGNHAKDASWKRLHALLVAQRELKNLKLQLEKLKRGERDDLSQQETWAKEMKTVMKEKKQEDLLDKTLAEKASVEAQIQAADVRLHEATKGALKYLVQREGGEAADKRQEVLDFEKMAQRKREQLKLEKQERTAKHNQRLERIAKEEARQAELDNQHYKKQQKLAKQKRDAKEKAKKQKLIDEANEKDAEENRQKTSLALQRQAKVRQQIKQRAIESDKKLKYLQKVNELQQKAAAKQRELAQQGAEMQSKLQAARES